MRKESTINKFGDSKVKIVPSLPQFRCFSTISKELDYSKLNPYYVTGFTDAEGCFLINIVRRSDLKLGYNVNLMFKIHLHLKDKLLLEKIRNFFDKIGNITVRKNGTVEYVVSSIKDLEIVINHFDNYPLITHK
ncbi:LAGLIDADG family homing endonuclease (plasmid) [Peribacillus frigoritolerans]|nr:LAGLIDADG family homing endonuclease [Peribacillus frigoritolerans]